MFCSLRLPDNDALIEIQNQPTDYRHVMSIYIIIIVSKTNLSPQNKHEMITNSNNKIKHLQRLPSEFICSARSIYTDRLQRRRSASATITSLSPYLIIIMYSCTRRYTILYYRSISCFVYSSLRMRKMTNIPATSLVVLRDTRTNTYF